jgi:AAA+ ATPase superfamily predicted ATPase
MRFINRKKELAYLNETYELSKKKNMSMFLYGLRRVGKTRLMFEFLKNKEGIYFFVNQNKSLKSIIEEFVGILKQKNIMSEYENIDNFDDLLFLLFERYKGCIVFDEFQNFKHVDKSVFGSFQKYIDLYEEKSGLSLFFLGSVVGMLKDIFKSKKEPLYGRIKREMHVKQLSFLESREFLVELGIDAFEEQIKFYSILGGFPRYYIALEDENIKTFKSMIQKFFLNENPLFFDEIEKLLSFEFGKRYSIYYKILEAIAFGENKISKIANFAGYITTSISRQVSELVNHFELVSDKETVLSKKRYYQINHAMIQFWFFCFYKDMSSYLRRDSSFLKKLEVKINHFISYRFEVIVLELAPLIFHYDYYGKDFGKYKDGEKGKNEFEFDLIGYSCNDILVGECKWKDNVNSLDIINKLKNKCDNLHLKKEKKYAVFARSFKEKNENCFDLDDLLSIIDR